jgi:hypothetical protein
VDRAGCPPSMRVGKHIPALPPVQTHFSGNQRATGTSAGAVLSRGRTSSSGPSTSGAEARQASPRGCEKPDVAPAFLAAGSLGVSCGSDGRRVRAARPLGRRCGLDWYLMNTDHPDYPLYAWDRQWWKYLDVLGGAKRKEVPDAAAVYDRLVQYAFAGDIAWDYVLQADSIDEAKRGLALLFERMAGELTTSDQLRGLLTSMNSAAEETVKFREATGSAGKSLEDRALGRHGARPLPRGWQGVLTSLADPSFPAGGSFWAQRILAAARRASDSGSTR